MGGGRRTKTIGSLILDLLLGVEKNLNRNKRMMSAFSFHWALWEEPMIMGKGLGRKTLKTLKNPNWHLFYNYKTPLHIFR